jgi:endonuclease/exonuclease/phosphatase family metal-dependent hydrolase
VPAQTILFLLLLPVLPAAALSAYSSASIRTTAAISDENSQLVETGQAAKHERLSQAPAEIKIVSYNIRWRSGEDLKKLAGFMRDDPEIGGASILGLQEVDRNKKRSKNENGARMLATHLNMHYAWAAPPTPKSEKEEETGVTILSKYPLTDVRRLVLPHSGPGGRRRVALGATVTIGDQQVRFYSVHSETRMSIDKKIEQMKAVLEDLKMYPKSTGAIVVGDLNTWEMPAEEKTIKLFKSEGFHTPFRDEPTFSRRILFMGFQLRLDWIWLRNLEAVRHGINRKINQSDHWPLWTILRINKPSKAGS